ncbi:MAG: rRNA pseudouridine synthase [Caldiserica bacterium]|nr:rRNA pseudouridine synthase [Caldisericota bacterium]
MKERLQKIISRAGIASRRRAEELIKEGKVKVDGEVVTILGTKADPGIQRIEVEGKVITLPEKIYLLLYKPRYCITTLYDPQGRKTVADLLENMPTRVFPVGRLDFDAEGLLIFTNDGEFANILLHPRYGISKTYIVELSGIPSRRDLEQIRKGVRLEDGMTLPARAVMVKKDKNKAWIKLTIQEGRYREIKRMFSALGYTVTRLKRIKIGPFKLGKLKPGEYRFLSQEEVNEFLAGDK